MRSIKILKVIFFILVFQMIVTTSGCVTDTKPIRIGISVNLSGRDSEIGTSCRNSVELVVEDFNKKGGIKGRKIELIVNDDKGTDEGAIESYKALVSQKVVAIIGSMTSNTCAAVIPFVNSKDILLISPSVSGNSLYNNDDNLITSISSNKEQGKMLAETAYKELGGSKVAVVYDLRNKVYTEELYGFFEKRYEELGGKIDWVEKLIPGEIRNFHDISSRICASGAKGVLVCTSGIDAGIIVQNLKSIKEDMKVYAGFWTMNSDFIRNGGKAIEGTTLVGVHDVFSNSKAYLRFKEIYNQAYKSEPNNISMLSYEMAQVLFTSLQNVDDYSAATIKSNILQVSNYQGLQTEFFIDKYGDAHREYFLFKVFGDVYKRVG